MPLNVVCIGAGTIGCGWAAAFGAGGHRVTLVDTDEHKLAQAQHQVVEMLRLRARHRPLTDPGCAIRPPEATTDLGAALRDCDYVQESVFEDVNAKRTLFEAIDRAVPPQALVGSSTSAIPGSRFMGSLAMSERALVVHPTNPPHLVPLVELCATPWTSARTLESVESMLAGTGHVTVRVRREIPGYVLNRLQAAVVLEALHLVSTNVISPMDLDRVMVAGLGLRWAVCGPFLTGHLNAPGGYADYMGRYGAVYRTIGADLRLDHPWTDDDLIAVDAAIRAATSDATVQSLQSWRDDAIAQLWPIASSLRTEVPE